MATKRETFLCIESTQKKTKPFALSKWPTRTPLNCYEHGGEIKGVPIPMVHFLLEYDKRIIHICVDQNADKHYFPVFCSLNCMLGHIVKSNLANLTVLTHNAKMIEHFWKEYFQFEFKECNLATRPRHLLQQFGGPMTESEFRKGFCAFVDKRPATCALQQVVSAESEKDLIYWNLFKPNVLPAVAVDKPVLTSVEDPSDICALQMESAPIVDLDVKENPTIRTICDVVQDVVSFGTVQQVSQQLARMEISPMTPRRAPPTFDVSSPNGQPDRKRLKPSKPSPKKMSPQKLHPMFRGFK